MMLPGTIMMIRISLCRTLSGSRMSSSVMYHHVMMDMVTNAMAKYIPWTSMWSIDRQLNTVEGCAITRIIRSHHSGAYVDVMHITVQIQ